MKASETIEIYGPRNLSDREVISLIVGEEVGGVLCDLYGSLADLARCSVSEIKKVKGIGPRKARLLVAAFDLSRRTKHKYTSVIRSSIDVFNVVKSHFAMLNQETFLTLSIDAKHRVLSIRDVSRGTVNNVEVHPRDVFSSCVRESAMACVVAHNHPSGDPEPSPDDVSLTYRLRDAGSVLGIILMDHVIIGNDTYVSFADRGIL